MRLKPDAGPQPRTDLGFARRPRSLPRTRGASDAAAPPPRKGHLCGSPSLGAPFPRAGAPMEHPRPAPTGAPQGTDVKPTAPQRTLVERLRVPVLLPDSKLRNYWDALMFVVIFYNCNLTPVSITAPPASDIFRRLRRVDFAIDLLFLVDTLLGFCCAFHDPHTKELVTQRKAIRDAYLQSARLKLNLLAVSPLLTLPNPFSSFFGGGACKVLFQGSSKRIARKTCLKAARLTRSSRLFLFFAQLEAVRKILEDQKLLVMNGAAFRMLQIIVSLIFMCSFCGGFYFFLACNDPSPDKAPKCGYGTSTSWVGSDEVFRDGRTSWDAIIARAFHFCVQTLFTIGYGDSVAPVSEVELKFAVALMLAGAVVSYTSKRQTCIAMSSTEAEIIAASAAALEIVYLRGLLAEMGLPQLSLNFQKRVKSPLSSRIR